VTAEFPKQVTLREVGPRDGFQNVAAFIPTEGKLKVIKSLAEAGLREIEVTSFINAKVVPQLADAEAIMTGLAAEGFIRSVLVPTPKYAMSAIEAGADQLVVFLSASEGHNRANVNRSVPESLAGLDTIFSLAADQGVPVVGAIATSFGCPYDGDVPTDNVLTICAHFRDFGADGIILGDTTGMAMPPAVTHLVKSYQDRFSAADMTLHFHNNRGTAMSNLYAALQAGAARFDTALGGIGGCPTVPQAAGNLATEDVVCLLHEMGIETGVDLDRLITAARDMEELLGYALPGQVMKSGPIDWHAGAT